MHACLLPTSLSLESSFLLLVPSLPLVKAWTSCSQHAEPLWSSRKVKVALAGTNHPLCWAGLLSRAAGRCCLSAQLELELTVRGWQDDRQSHRIPSTDRRHNTEAMSTRLRSSSSSSEVTAMAVARSQDLEKIKESDLICFPSLLPKGGIKVVCVCVSVRAAPPHQVGVT